MISIFAVFLGSCAQKNEHVPLPSQQSDNKDSGDTREKILHRFVVDQLTGAEGIYTNYKDTDQNELTATGHEVLSESMGLIMRYYARSGQKKLFDEAWKRTENNLDMERGFSYRYSSKQNKRYTVNAAIDDLRIIRALYEAANQFEHEPYREVADELGKRLIHYNVSENQLYDFYDAQFEMNNDFITLCYIDLRTLKLMTVKTDNSELIENMLHIAQNGYLSDEFPFYETRYLYDQARYQSEDINTIESLLTILSLVEVGKHQASSIEFIKTQVEQGTLYGKYSRDGQPLTTIQSTAIYAITAMIGSELDDQQLYRDSIEKMEQFQILQPENELFGAYGDAESLQAYSFDNLQALLAYTY